MINQAEEVIGQCETAVLFLTKDCKSIRSQRKPFQKTTTTLNPPDDSYIYKSLVQQSKEVTELSLSTLHQPNLKLSAGKLLIHELVQVMGATEVQMLCNSLGITSPHHRDKIRYGHRDLVLPNCFVMAGGIANTSLDLGEILYEDIPYCANINTVNYGDQIGTMTYIEKCNKIEGTNLEEVEMKHIILKQLDMDIVSRFNIPLKLCEIDEKTKPSDIELLCARSCPILHHKITCIIARKIIRICSALVQPPMKIPQELYLEE